MEPLPRPSGTAWSCGHVRPSGTASPFPGPSPQGDGRSAAYVHVPRLRLAHDARAGARAGTDTKHGQRGGRPDSPMIDTYWRNPASRLSARSGRPPSSARVPLGGPRIAKVYRGVPGLRRQRGSWTARPECRGRRCAVSSVRDAHDRAVITERPRLAGAKRRRACRGIRPRVRGRALPIVGTAGRALVGDGRVLRAVFDLPGRQAARAPPKPDKASGYIASASRTLS